VNFVKRGNRQFYLIGRKNLAVKNDLAYFVAATRKVVQNWNGGKVKRAFVTDTAAKIS
jgi:hypothetical protein